MASSTVLIVLSFFYLLDRLDVGVMLDGPASSSSRCEYAVGSEDALGLEDAGSSSEPWSSPLLTGATEHVCVV